MSEAEKFRLEMMSTVDLAALALQYKRELQDLEDNSHYWNNAASQADLKAKKRELERKRKDVLNRIKSRQLKLF